MLPKFLIADNSQELPDKIFAVHTEEPQFIFEANIDNFEEEQEVHWISAEPDSEEEIDNLIAEAMEFLVNELENQETLFDDDESDEF